MPDQVLPIRDLAAVGLIEDTPAVIIPPNAFSDCENVRFHDGVVQKFPGESEELSSLTGVVYAATWNSTAGIKYVVVTEATTTATITVYNDDWTAFQINSTPLTGTMPTSSEAEWQHDEFNGGFQFIINNGVTTPRFLQIDTTSPAELPGWDSYAVDTVLMDFEADGSQGVQTTISATLAVGTSIKITNIPRNLANPIRTETVTVNSSLNGVTPDGTLDSIGTISSVSNIGFNFTPANGLGGNRFVISIVSTPIASVTAGVVRSFGNLLVAGNLREVGGRTLPGVIRTSDVAAPGRIPENWNPFNLGVNTADEFPLSTTGTVRDIVELQGNLYVYTDRSIHSIQRTGNPNIPFSTAPVTNNYGADNIDSVIEVDGKHIVVGSEDVYIFPGHPGGIQSIADSKVRNAFRDNPNYKIVRMNKYDELWFYDGTAVQYIFNYRTGVWTKRRGSIPVSLAEAQGDILLATSTSVRTVDNTTSYLPSSYNEMTRKAITPEFDTETLISIALLADSGSFATDPGSFEFFVTGTNSPDEDFEAAASNSRGTFSISNDYKKDIRITGRFLNLRLSHQGPREVQQISFSGSLTESQTGDITITEPDGTTTHEVPLAGPLENNEIASRLITNRIAETTLTVGNRYEITTVTAADWSSVGGPMEATVGNIFTCTTAATAQELTALGAVNRVYDLQISGWTLSVSEDNNLVFTNNLGGLITGEFAFVDANSHITGTTEVTAQGSEGYFNLSGIQYDIGKGGTR